MIAADIIKQYCCVVLHAGSISLHLVHRLLAVKLPKTLAVGLKMRISGPKQPRVVPARHGSPCYCINRPKNPQGLKLWALHAPCSAPLISYISPPNSSWTPEVFYTCFYNHDHRLSLEKLLYQWPRSGFDLRPLPALNCLRGS